MSGLGLAGGPALRWDREYYASGSSLPGDLVDGSGVTPVPLTGWTSSGGYLVPSTGATSSIRPEIASVCTTQASPSGYPEKPPLSFVRVVSCAARWPSGGVNGKSSSLWVAVGFSYGAHYANGITPVYASMRFVIEHTYGASGGTWSPNYSGLTEDADISIALVSINDVEFHALVNGSVVASRDNVYSTGIDFRPINDNQALRDCGGLWAVGFEMDPGIGTNKECRFRKLSSWVSRAQLPGI